MTPPFMIPYSLKGPKSFLLNTLSEYEVRSNICTAVGKSTSMVQHIYSVIVLPSLLLQTKKNLLNNVILKPNCVRL